MKLSLLVRIISFVIVAIFVLNFLVLLVFFQLSSSSISSAEVSPLMLKLQSREAFGKFEKKHLRKNDRRQQQRNPIEVDEKGRPHFQTNCQAYGCPVYPPELAHIAANQTIWKALQEKGYFESHHPFEFASKAFVTLTQQGASHKFNQDRGLYVSPFLPDLVPLISKNKAEARSFLVCIFDGHGELGHEVAQEMVEKFPLLLGQKLTLSLHDSTSNNRIHKVNKDDPIVIASKDYDSTDIAIRKALNETFLEINEKGNPSNFLLAGCTASVTLRWGSKLYIANTGDSETVVISALSSLKHPPTNLQQQQQQKQDLPIAQVEYATRRDKGNLPAERARIEGLGGKIHVNAKGFDPRVIHYSDTLKENVGLAMSRSIGDWEFKAVGVIAEPTIDIIELSNIPLSDSEKTLFLMAASDGLWEQRQKHFFATRMAASFGTDNKDDNLRPLYHLFDVIHRITPKRQDGYRDDITAIVVNLK